MLLIHFLNSPRGGLTVPAYYMDDGMTIFVG